MWYYNTAGSIGGSATSSTWTTSGNGTFGNVSDPTTTYTFGTTEIASGTVTLTLTTNDPPANPCNAVSDNIVITVVRAPAVNAGADVAVCQGTVYTVNDATASNYASLNWTENGAGNITAGQGTTSPTYTPGAGDIGVAVTLTLNATGNAPCANTSDSKILYLDRTPVATVGAMQNLCNITAANLAGNTGGTDLANGAYGEWTFINNLIWQETFSESPEFSTSGTQWGTSGGFTPDADTYFRTESRRIVGRDLDAQAVWQSAVVNISAVSPVNISVLVQGAANLEGSDYVRVYYKLDSGAETLFTTNGNNTGNFGTRTASVTGLSGNTVQIVVRVQNSANDEYSYIDIIEVRTYALQSCYYN